MADRLAIVLPAYNEEACIEDVVRKWVTIFDKTPGELWIVNDGSRDRTATMLDALAKKEPRLRVVHQKNAGHGAAVLRGYRTAIRENYDYVFQTDSDDQFETEDFWKLWAARKEAPFVLGLRAKRSDPTARKIISRIAAYWMGVLFFQIPRDANAPFRLFRTDVLAKLLDLVAPETDAAEPFAPNLFLTIAAKTSGVPMREIPVFHRERQTGTVSILRWKLLRVCLRTARELFELRFSLMTRQKDIETLRELSSTASGTTKIQKSA